MRIETIVCGPVSVNTYLLIPEGAGETIIVDPGDSAPVADYIDKNGLKPKAILLTHGHFDHMMGCAKLKEKYGIPVYVHSDDENMLTDPTRCASPFFVRNPIDAVPDPVLIRGGETIDLVGLRFKVLHTPGHTPGGVCYVIDSEKLVLCGDTVFRESVGRTDFKYSNTAMMYAAIRKHILPLPDDYRILPGHGPETTVGYERKNNPYLRIMQ